MARDHDIIVLDSSSDASDSESDDHQILPKKPVVFGDYVLSREERYLLAADEEDESDVSADEDDDYDDHDDSFGDGARAFAKKRRRPTDSREVSKRRKTPPPSRTKLTTTRRRDRSECEESEDEEAQPFRHSSMILKMEKARLMKAQQIKKSQSTTVTKDPRQRVGGDQTREKTKSSKESSVRRDATPKKKLMKPQAARKSAAPVNGKVVRPTKRSQREEDSEESEEDNSSEEESEEIVVDESRDDESDDREILRKRPLSRRKEVEEIEILDDSDSEESEAEDKVPIRRPSKQAAIIRTNGESVSRPAPSKVIPPKKSSPPTLPPKPKSQPRPPPKPSSQPVPTASQTRTDSVPVVRSSRAVAALPENMPIEEMQAQERELAYFKQMQKRREQLSQSSSTSQPAQARSSSKNSSRSATGARKSVTTQNVYRLKRHDSAASIVSSVSNIASSKSKPLAKAKLPMPFAAPTVREGFSATGMRNVMTTVSVAADASSSFAAEEKVDHIPLPHNTWWRQRLQFVRAPLNIMPAESSDLSWQAFSRVKERELCEFDDSGTILPLAELASPPKLSTNALLTLSLESQENVNSKVRRVIDESLPVLKQCHKRRVQDIILEMRNSLPWSTSSNSSKRSLRKSMRNVTSESTDVAPIELVHEKRRLQASLPRAKADQPNRLVGSIRYIIGAPRTTRVPDSDEGQDAVYERFRFPETIIVFGEDLAPMRRTCTWICVKTNVHVEDDPILRYIPYLGDKERVNIDPRRYDATTLDKDRTIVVELLEGDKSEGDEDCVKTQDRLETWRSHVTNLAHATRSAIDDEVMEYLLCVVIKQCGRSDKVFQALREVGGFAEPITDYDVIQKREETTRSINKRINLLRRCLEAENPDEHPHIRKYVAQLAAKSDVQSDGESVSQRLRTPIASFSLNYLEHPQCNGLRRGKSVGLVMEWYRDLFCRRCYTYDCQQHGIKYPKPSSRADPLNPVVKKSGVGLTRAKKPQGSGDNDAIEIDSSSSSSSDESQVEDDAQSTVSGSMDGEGEQTDAADRRRSRRSGTRASTLASASLQVQEVMVDKERRKLQRKQAKQLWKLVRHVDDSEYLDDSYREIVGPIMDKLISPEPSSSCNSMCWKKLAESATATSEMLPELTKVMLRKIIPILGDNSCLIAQLLRDPGMPPGVNSCAAIHRCIEEEKNKADGASLFDAAMHDDRYHDKTSYRRQHHQSRGIALHSGNRELIKRTRMNRAQQQMKEREHKYVPCEHDGLCNDSICECLKRGHDCDKACPCSRDCVNRHHGCKCLPGQCRAKACSCFEAARECDPDYCFSCGAHEAAVMEFDAQQRNTLASDVGICRNVSLLRGVHKKIGAAFSATHGWGAYALEPIRKGEFVYEYTGALITDDEAERRGNIYDAMKVSYLFDVNSDEVVDAMRKGNKIKFANHRTREEANLETKILVVRGEHRIALFAKWDIHVGEELFFDYGYTNETAPEWSQLRTPHDPRYVESDPDEDNEDLEEVLGL